MTPPETSALAVQLERMGADLGEIKTACAVLVERSQRTEQDVRDLRRDTDEQIKAVRAAGAKEVEAVRGDVARLQRIVWMAMGAGLMLGGAGGAALQTV